MSPSKIKRSANFSKSEEEKLLALVVERKNIFENKNSDAATSNQKNMEWKKLEKQFNDSSETNIIRTAKVLREKYNNIKRTLRKKKSNARNESIMIKREESGPSNPVNYSTLQKQILEQQMEHARLEHEQRMMHSAEEHKLKIQILEAELKSKQMCNVHISG